MMKVLKFLGMTTVILAFVGCTNSTTSGGGDGGSGASSGNGNGGSSTNGSDNNSGSSGSNSSPADLGDGSLFGSWAMVTYNASLLDTYNPDGTFVSAMAHDYSYYIHKQAYSGNYRVSGDTIECYSVIFQAWNDDGKTVTITDPERPYPDFSFQFRLGTDELGDYYMQNFVAGGTGDPITDDSVKYRRAP